VVFHLFCWIDSWHNLLPPIHAHGEKIGIWYVAYINAGLSSFGSENGGLIGLTLFIWAFYGIFIRVLWFSWMEYRTQPRSRRLPKGHQWNLRGSLPCWALFQLAAGRWVTERTSPWRYVEIPKFWFKRLDGCLSSNLLLIYLNKYKKCVEDWQWIGTALISWCLKPDVWLGFSILWEDKPAEIEGYAAIPRYPCVYIRMITLK
jgi:hypothetical protein